MAVQELIDVSNGRCFRRSGNGQWVKLFSELDEDTMLDTLGGVHKLVKLFDGRINSGGQATVSGISNYKDFVFVVGCDGYSSMALMVAENELLASKDKQFGCFWSSNTDTRFYSGNVLFKDNEVVYVPRILYRHLSDTNSWQVTKSAGCYLAAIYGLQ